MDGRVVSGGFELGGGIVRVGGVVGFDCYADIFAVTEFEINVFGDDRTVVVVDDEKFRYNW